MKWIDVTQLALTWVGWPSGEKVASTYMEFDLDQSERNQHQCSQTRAKRSRKWTQAFNWGLLASGLGQGFTLVHFVSVNVRSQCIIITLSFWYSLGNTEKYFFHVTHVRDLNGSSFVFNRLIDYILQSDQTIFIANVQLNWIGTCLLRLARVTSRVTRWIGSFKGPRRLTGNKMKTIKEESQKMLSRVLTALQPNFFHGLLA